MTLADYVRVLRVRWKVWLACVVLGVIAAGLFNYFATVTYAATATSFVGVTTVDSENPENFQNSQFAVQRVKSYAPLIASPDVIGPVIDDLDLDVTPRELRDMTTVTSPPETVLMEVRVTDTEADRAALIANSVAQRLGALIEEIETPPSGGSPTVEVTLTQPAEVPVAPASPRRMLNLVLGLVAGLAVGFVAALVRNALDRRVKTADDIRVITGAAPLGTTPRKRPYRGAPLAVLDPRAAAAESYRSVRTALKFVEADTALRHVVVSSPTADPSKSVLAANLAASWAQGGGRVCLVEADMRRPGVSPLLELDSGVGLTEVLLGDVELDDALVSWRDGLFTVLPSGSLPADPAALLGSDGMAALVTRLRDRFDMVIYDTAPVELVTDAVVVGRVVDGVVLVVRAESTSRDELTSSLETLRSSHVELLGTVLSASGVRGAQAQPYPPTERRSRGRQAPLQEDQERDAVGESGINGKPSGTPTIKDAGGSNTGEADPEPSTTKAGAKNGLGAKLRS